MRKAVIYGILLVAIVFLIAACRDSANKRDGEARDFIDVQRTVSGESMATCLAKNGFTFSDSYSSVDNSINVAYDHGKTEAVTINVNPHTGKVAPWNDSDDSVLLKYHCQPSDVQDNSPQQN